VKNIIVCMKQVLDPEIPLSLFHIDTEARQAIPPKATPPVLSPFDENALEAALKIKDTQESNVTVISLGKKLNRVVVSSALAAGADHLVLLQDEAFSDFNTYLTAGALAAAIKKLGPYDLILCGLQAADTNTGQVGTGIASMLIRLELKRFQPTVPRSLKLPLRPWLQPIMRWVSCVNLA